MQNHPFTRQEFFKYRYLKMLVLIVLVNIYIVHDTFAAEEQTEDVPIGFEPSEKPVPNAPYKTSVIIRYNDNRNIRCTHKKLATSPLLYETSILINDDKLRAISKDPLVPVFFDDVSKPLICDIEHDDDTEDEILNFVPNIADEFLTPIPLKATTDYVDESTDNSPPEKVVTENVLVGERSKEDTQNYAWLITGFQLSLLLIPILVGIYFTCFDCDKFKKPRPNPNFVDPFAIELDQFII